MARVTIVSDSGPVSLCYRNFFGVCYGCQEYIIEVRYIKENKGSGM